MASPYAAEPPNPIPKYVYKITTEPPPKLDSLAGDHLPLSALDAQDGFIHLSTGARVPVTAGLFFGSLQQIWVLKISVESSESAESTSSSKPKLKWLPSDSEELWGCVHLYGGGLGSHNIVGSKEYQRSEEKEWKDAIAKADEVDGFLADA